MSRKRFFWFRAANKPARSLPSATPSPWGVSPLKQGQPTGKKRQCLLRAAPKPARPSVPVTSPQWGISPSKSDPLADREGCIQPCPAYSPARHSAPAAPSLLRAHPVQQGTPRKQEQMLLVWPPLPASSPPSLCGSPGHRREQKRVVPAQPLPPAAPRRLLLDTGPVRRVQPRAGKDSPNQRRVSKPPGHLCLGTQMHSVGYSPGRRDGYWC